MRNLSTVGKALITVLRWSLRVLLVLLRIALEMAKVILLIFGFVVRLFLVFVRAGTP